MSAPTVRLWLGTSPETDDAGDGGIWSVDLDGPADPAGTAGAPAPVLRARTPAPSFLALTPDGRSLFAAGETSPGAVTRFVVGPDGRLAEAERVSSGGSGPCHLLLDPSGRALYVANYASGSVAVVPLRPDASIAGGVAQVFEHSGRGPVRDRQEGPHVHSTALTPDGAVLLAFDLGTDEIRRYRVRADGLLDADGVALRLPPGTGPRHAAWGPGDHLYVTGELDASVHVLAWDGARLRPVEVAGDLSAGGGEALAAHVVRQGGLLLASVRGPDVVGLWRIADGGARLEHLGAVPVGAVGAAWPRHFALLDEGVAPPGEVPAAVGLVVAGQRSDVVAVLRVDPMGGSAGGSARGPAGGPGVLSTGEPVLHGPVPAPTCVVMGRVALPDAR